MQGRNRDADVENGRVTQPGKDWVGQIKRVALTDTNPCEVDSWWEAAVLHRELSSALCDDSEGWDRGGVGREAREGGIICRLIPDSCCCTAETNTTL